MSDTDELKILKSIVDQFVKQLAIKKVGNNSTIVWSGDYDSISNEDLRKLVLNFLNAYIHVYRSYDDLKSTEEVVKYIFSNIEKRKGCPCACHNGQTVWHFIPCHDPLLTELSKKTFI